MTSDASLGFVRHPAADSAGTWDDIALPPDLRQAVERIAASEGIDPLSWLARAVARAASEAPATDHDAASPRSARDIEIARSLTRLLAAVRAREGEPPPLEEPTAEPPRPRIPMAEPPALVRLTAERARAEQDAESLPVPPRPKRHYGVFLLAGALLVAALVGVAAFYLGLENGTAIREASVNMPLPQPPTPVPTAAPPPAAAPTEPTTTRAPASEPQSSAPAAASSTPAPPPAAASPAAPASTAGTPAETPAPQPSASAPPAASTPPVASAPSSPGPTESATVPSSEPATPPETATAIGPAEALAAFRLGVRYAFGDGVAQDYQKAAEQFRIAAQQGLPDAEYNLGALYDGGLGVPRDAVRAVIWYHSAAEQGHPAAQLNLGLAYANGSGVAQDYGEAARWFRRAADQGVVTAQYNLAALYANGKGVTQSMIDAYAWFSIAAGSGDIEAKKQMQRVAATLNAKQLRDAKALAISLGQEIGHTGEPQHEPSSAPDSSGAPRRPTGGAPAATPDNASAPPDRVVVAEIQRYLTRLHYEPGREDGTFSEKTAESIRKYQTDRGMKVDGEPSRPLLFRLKAEVQQAKQ